MKAPSALAVIAAATMMGCAATRPAAPPPSPQLAEPPVRLFSEALWLPPVGMGGRSALVIDPVAAQLVADPSHQFEEGEEVRTVAGKTERWRTIAADADGSFEPEGPWSFSLQARLKSGERRVLLLEAGAHRTVHVNGVARMGDHYGHGLVRLPVELAEGTNTFVFTGARPGIAPRLTDPPAPMFISDRDELLPMPRVGVALDRPAAAVVVNATTAPIHGASIAARFDGHETIVTRLPDIGPLETRKVPFRVAAPAPLESETTRTLHLELRRAGSRVPAHTRDIPIAVRRTSQLYRDTYTSEIDASTQYYAVLPSSSPDPGQGLVLSLHGAAVEGLGQAGSYSPKDWCHIVAPNNRRPFGFDWEDWGRLDAMEALEVARGRLATDPLRTWVTGHSMGGHGTWQLASQFPGSFAGAAPSAGWISFATYGSAPPPRQEGAGAMLQRAGSPSDTASLFPNLRGMALYILHGDADDNVPPTEAREAARILTGLGIPFGYHEQPGVGHWWDIRKDSGADCVDWGPIFDMFRGASLPAPSERMRIDFRTFSPHASATHTWATVLQQSQPLRLSRLVAEVGPARDTISAQTTNIDALRLAFDAIDPNAREVAVVIDGGAPIRVPRSDQGATFMRRGGAWTRVAALPQGAKRPDAQGPFKQLFSRRVLLVHGTAGTAEEDAANYARARLDAEAFWVIGNASFEVVADTRLPRDWRERNLVLYGNSETHRLWDRVFDDGAPRVTRTSVEIPGRAPMHGDDLACLFVRGGNGGLVGAVSGTGLTGMRLSSRLYYFGSGSGFPDFLVVDASMLRQGLPGILAAGFFDNAWRYNPADTAP